MPLPEAAFERTYVNPTEGMVLPKTTIPDPTGELRRVGAGMHEKDITLPGYGFPRLITKPPKGVSEKLWVRMSETGLDI